MARRTVSTRVSLLGVLVGCLALVSCGGGGGGGSSPRTYALGGTVSGLEGTGLVVRSGAGEDLPISSNGSFAFQTALAAGTAYSVTVVQQPTSPSQACVVENGSGTMANAAVANVSVVCTTPPAGSHLVTGTVSGLVGSGLVLNNFQGEGPAGHDAGEDLVISSTGGFVFPTAVPEGTRFTVTVKANPASPTQNCTVANGTALMGNADVTNVAVTCTTAAFSIRGDVAGLNGTLVLQNNGGDNLTLTANGPFAFAGKVASGGGYAVSVLSKPAGQTCSVSGPRAGVVGVTDVTGIRVACSTTQFSVGGSVSGLSGTLVLQNNGGDDATLTADGAFTFPTQVATGGDYLVTVKTQPAERHCVVTNGAGTVGSAPVSNVSVSCGAVVQRWQAPTSWGALWPDSAAMVHHAFFDGSGIVSAKGGSFTWQGTAAEPTPRQFTGFPGAQRFGVGPFAGGRYQAAAGSDAALAALTGDMLVCAIVKPSRNPATFANGTEQTIVAKGIANGTADVPGGGWVLMQMHHHFCFHYQNTDGTTSHMAMAATPTYFADHDQPGNGPINPSYVVVCGGRVGQEIVVAANSYDEREVAALRSSTVTADLGAHPTTIGGSDTNDAAMAFGGRIYETAVWNEPATRENIEAKFAMIQGLAMPDGAVARYTRNREAAFQFASIDGQYHTVWRSGPRIDPAKGVLFGMQGWNRVVTQYHPTNPDQRAWFIATGETLHDGWTTSAGAIVTGNDIAPPGDAERESAARVTLPANASISTPLAADVGAGFDRPGPIHGQIWVRRPVTTTEGTLRVRVSNPAPTGSDRFDIDLGAIPADTWTRVWLYRSPGGVPNELTTDGSQTTPGTVSLENGGPSHIEFWAWGLDLTQIGGGVDAPILDPGVEMYDGSLKVNDWRQMIDVLRLPAVSRSTAATGYCLSVDARPGIAWDAPFEKRRSIVTWRNGTQFASIYSPAHSELAYAPEGARQICFGVSGALFDPCFLPPLRGWTADALTHNIKGCVGPTGDVAIYADDVRVGNTTTGATAVDLSGGELLVGGDGDGVIEAPWSGFVSKVLACFNTADNATSCR